MVAVDLRYWKKYIMICKIQIASSQTVLCIAATAVKHTWVIKFTQQNVGFLSS